MTRHTTHLTSEELPEPGEIRRVVSVHPGNRTYETVPVGHDAGWLVADPHGTNPVYWTDDEVSEVHDGWVRNQHGVPAAVLSRHGSTPGADPEPEAKRPRRSRRSHVVGEPEPATSNTGGGANVEPGDGDDES